MNHGPVDLKLLLLQTRLYNLAKELFAHESLLSISLSILASDEIIIIIMVIFKCYFSGELIALTKNKYYKKKKKKKKRRSIIQTYRIR